MQKLLDRGCPATNEGQVLRGMSCRPWGLPQIPNLTRKGRNAGDSLGAVDCAVLLDDRRGGRAAVPGLLVEHLQERGGER